ncbi:MAG: hypothetical protein LIP01_00695, partial [Tannerellaceae bacterium]|nr:hypothetical protein [Tannerellaceae bacterium]
MKYLGLLLLLCIVFACSQDDSKGSFDDNYKQQLVRFDVRSISDNLKNNIDVYVFNGAAGVDYDYFNHKVLNIERTEDSLKMRMPVGEWNLVLVGCSESDIRSSLTAPTILNDKSSIVMWETKPQGGYLPDVPEIRTALIDGVEILENQTTEKSALLERNVAKVRVVVVESYGLDNTTSGVEHYVTLNDVPTALA